MQIYQKIGGSKGRCRIEIAIKFTSLYLVLPSDFRVAYAANVSEHAFTHPTMRITKTRPQHRELRPLLFANSE